MVTRCGGCYSSQLGTRWWPPAKERRSPSFDHLAKTDRDVHHSLSKQNEDDSWRAFFTPLSPLKPEKIKTQKCWNVGPSNLWLLWHICSPAAVFPAMRPTHWAAATGTPIRRAPRKVSAGLPSCGRWLLPFHLAIGGLYARELQRSPGLVVPRAD